MEGEKEKEGKMALLPSYFFRALDKGGRGEGGRTGTLKQRLREEEKKKEKKRRKWPISSWTNLLYIITILN